MSLEQEVAGVVARMQWRVDQIAAGRAGEPTELIFERFVDMEPEARRAVALEYVHRARLVRTWRQSHPNARVTAPERFDLDRAPTDAEGVAHYLSQVEADLPVKLHQLMSQETTVRALAFGEFNAAVEAHQAFFWVASWTLRQLMEIDQRRWYETSYADGGYGWLGGNGGRKALGFVLGRLLADDSVPQRARVLLEDHFSALALAVEAAE